MMKRVCKWVICYIVLGVFSQRYLITEQGQLNFDLVLYHSLSDQPGTTCDFMEGVGGICLSIFNYILCVVQ